MCRFMDRGYQMTLDHYRWENMSSGLAISN